MIRICVCIINEKLWFGYLSTRYIGLNFNHFTNKQKNVRVLVYWYIY